MSDWWTDAWASYCVWDYNLTMRELTRRDHATGTTKPDWEQTLNDDVCRCHDAECPEREECQRWLDRGRCSRPNARVVHASSLRWPPDEHGHCGAKIPVKQPLSKLSEEDYSETPWDMGNYVDLLCPNCGRQRVCLCDNGKHRCDKCNWVIEDEEYCIEPLDKF